MGGTQTLGGEEIGHPGIGEVGTQSSIHGAREGHQAGEDVSLCPRTEGSHSSLVMGTLYGKGRIEVYTELLTWVKWGYTDPLAVGVWGTLMGEEDNGGPTAMEEGENVGVCRAAGVGEWGDRPMGGGKEWELQRTLDGGDWESCREPIKKRGMDGCHTRGAGCEKPLVYAVCWAYIRYKVSGPLPPAYTVNEQVI